MDPMLARGILELGRHDVVHLWEIVAVGQEAVRARAAKFVLGVGPEGLGDCDRSTGLQRKDLDERVLTIVEAAPVALESAVLCYKESTYLTDVELTDRSFETVVVGALVGTVSV